MSPAPGEPCRPAINDRDRVRTAGGRLTHRLLSRNTKSGETADCPRVSVDVLRRRKSSRSGPRRASHTLGLKLE
jgi:hypothetical protein